MRTNKDRITKIQQLIRDPEYNGFYLDDLESGGPLEEEPLTFNIPPPQTASETTSVQIPLPSTIPLESQEEYDANIDTEVLQNQMDSDISISGREPFVDYTKIMEEERVQKEVKKVEKYNSKFLDLENVADLQTKLQGAGFKMPISFKNETPDGILGKETATTLQKFLTRKGFGKYLGKYGIDGKIGEKTVDALDRYNQSITPKEEEEDISWYKSDTYKPDITSFAGECEEEQCASFSQGHLSRQLNVPMEQIRELGLRDDAWAFRENILNSGGESIFDRKTDYTKGDFNKNNKLGLKEGDILSIELPATGPFASPSRGEALRESNTPETHTAIVDKVNPDGTFTTVENLHGRASDKDRAEGKKFQGKVYVKKVNNRTGVYGSKLQPLTINYITRPNYSNVTQAQQEKQANVESFDATNKIVINGESTPALNKVVRSMNDPKLKQELLGDFNINEEEYNTLAKALIGIGGQETRFGGYTWKIPKAPGKLGDIEAKTLLQGKQIASLVAKTLTNLNLTRKDKLLHQPYDVSRGMFKLKYMDNFDKTDQALLKKFGIGKGLLSGKSQFVSAMYKLANHYNKLKMDFPPEEALYKAIALYNKGSLYKRDKKGKTVMEWTDEKDVDYVNKVLEYSKIAEVVGESNTNKLTSIDILNNSQEVITNSVLRKYR